jgi:hypothetical protein
MINSFDATKINLPELTLQKVIFKRKINFYECHEGQYTLPECISYLQNAKLKYDDVCTTHQNYIFQQNVCVSDARFLYKKASVGVIFLWQKYKKNCDYKLIPVEEYEF